MPSGVTTALLAGFKQIHTYQADYDIPFFLLGLVGCGCPHTTLTLQPFSLLTQQGVACRVGTRGVLAHLPVENHFPVRDTSEHVRSVELYLEPTLTNP